MKRLMIGIILLVAFSANASFAQNLAGTWQGALQVPQAPGGQLRLVIKISRADDGSLKGLFYSIDQSGQGVSTGPISLQNPSVKIPIPGIGGTFEGRLSQDGNSITGNFAQGPTPMPLNLTRATTETAWAIPEPPPPPKPMATDANPEFEVATIKPGNPDTPGKAITIRGREVVTINTTLSDLITFAYEIHARQITGAPAWIETDKYDITAKPDGEGLPNQNQMKSMLRKLLAERFKLAFHREQKELAVYAIVVGKDGPKLTQSTANMPYPSLMFRGLGSLPVRNATMADLAGVMQTAVLDRPVLDQTGLQGRWDFTLDWRPDQSQFIGLGGVPPQADDTDARPDLFTAMQQQLGLKLESKRAAAEVLVIDRVDKPSEN
jgi:uncharacterized protein (TIGR03435 family)